MDEEELLQKIGLTRSEAKVYLALLKINKFASKGIILKEAKIAPSKIYHVLGKLIDKGLASTITRNNVKHFAAAPPNRLKEYLEVKKQALLEEEKLADKILPKLEGFYKTFKEQTTAEIFLGWKGMETAYSTILDEMKRGQTAYILGASRGDAPEKTKRFFFKYSLKTKAKGVQVKVIFNENSRNYVKALERQTKIIFNKRFLFKHSNVEIGIANTTTAIVMLKEEPIIIVIRDNNTTNSFRTYFEELWKVAKR